MTELKEKIDAAYKHYKEKYFDYSIGFPKIPWQAILHAVRQFKQNEYLYATDINHKADWFGFLKLLIYTESTIDLYGYFTKGSLWRIFTLFGRAYLEEKEVLTSKRAKEELLEWQDKNAEFFTGGNPKFDPDNPTKNADLISKLTGKTYDVKHEKPSFNKAHFSDPIAFKAFNGLLEHYDFISECYVGSFGKVRSLKDIVISYELDPLLFTSKAEDNDIGVYLGMHYLDTATCAYMFSEF